MSFTGTFPTNIVKFSVAGVKVPRYIWVCNARLIYVGLGDLIDPSNHRHIYDALTCTANNIVSWINKISSYVSGVS